MNYDGILIVSFNTSAPNEGNSQKRKSQGGEITPEKRVKK